MKKTAAFVNNLFISLNDGDLLQYDKCMTRFNINHLNNLKTNQFENSKKEKNLKR